MMADEEHNSVRFPYILSKLKRTTEIYNLEQ